jgi:hypothetical protein
MHFSRKGLTPSGFPRIGAPAYEDSAKILCKEKYTTTNINKQANSCQDFIFEYLEPQNIIFKIGFSSFLIMWYF